MALAALGEVLGEEIEEDATELIMEGKDLQAREHMDGAGPLALLSLSLYAMLSIPASATPVLCVLQA